MTDAADEIRQSKLGSNTCFTFASDEVVYHGSDAGGSRTVSAPYESINLDDVAHYLLPTRYPSKYTAPIAGIIFIVGGTRLPYTFGLGLTLLAIGVTIMAIGEWASTWKRFRLGTDKIPIFGSANTLCVLHAPNRQHILDRLAEHKCVVLRARYSDVDLNNDPNRERLKFDWLLKNGVITADEHAAALASIAAAHMLSLEHDATIN